MAVQSGSFTIISQISRQLFCFRFENLIPHESMFVTNQERREIEWRAFLGHSHHSKSGRTLKISISTTKI